VVLILVALHGFRPCTLLFSRLLCDGSGGPANVHTVLQNLRPLGGGSVDSTAAQADL
jgi:hypothetical protein